MLVDIIFSFIFILYFSYENSLNKVRESNIENIKHKVLLLDEQISYLKDTLKVKELEKKSNCWEKHLGKFNGN